MASHNGSQESFYIPVNLPLNSLELYFIPSGIFCFVPDKMERKLDGEGMRVREKCICLFAEHFDIIGTGISLAWRRIWKKGLRILFSGLEATGRCLVPSKFIPLSQAPGF